MLLGNPGSSLLWMGPEWDMPAPMGPVQVIWSLLVSAVAPALLRVNEKPLSWALLSWVWHLPSGPGELGDVPHLLWFSWCPSADSELAVGSCGSSPALRQRTEKGQVRIRSKTASDTGVYGQSQARQTPLQTWVP